MIQILHRVNSLISANHHPPPIPSLIEAPIPYFTNLLLAFWWSFSFLHLFLNFLFFSCFSYPFPFHHSCFLPYQDGTRDKNVKIRVRWKNDGWSAELPRTCTGIITAIKMSWNDYWTTLLTQLRWKIVTQFVIGSTGSDALMMGNNWEAIELIWRTK